MNTILDIWNSLPVAKQQQLSTQYSFKTHGTTEEQLVWDLENKLPQGLLEVTEKVKEEVTEAPVEPKTTPKSDVETKEVETPKKAKKDY